MQKPFSARELLSTVRAQLGFQASQAERLMTGRMDSLETIAGGIAHEINNPLNYIQQGLGVLQTEVERLQTVVTSTREGKELNAREVAALSALPAASSACSPARAPASSASARRLT